MPRAPPPRRRAPPDGIPWSLSSSPSLCPLPSFCAVVADARLCWTFYPSRVVRAGSEPARMPGLLSGNPLAQAITFGDLDQQLVVVADDPVNPKLHNPLHGLLVVDCVRHDLEAPRLQPGHLGPVEVLRVLAQVPVLGLDHFLVRVVDLQVGRDGGGAGPADELAEVADLPPVLRRGPRALDLRVVVVGAQRALVGQSLALLGAVLPDEGDRFYVGVEVPRGADRAPVEGL